MGVHRQPPILCPVPRPVPVATDGQNGGTEHCACAAGLRRGVQHHEHYHYEQGIPSYNQPGMELAWHCTQAGQMGGQ